MRPGNNDAGARSCRRSLLRRRVGQHVKVSRADLSVRQLEIGVAYLTARQLAALDAADLIVADGLPAEVGEPRRHVDLRQFLLDSPFARLHEPPLWKR